MSTITKNYNCLSLNSVPKPCDNNNNVYFKYEISSNQQKSSWKVKSKVSKNQLIERSLWDG